MGGIGVKAGTLTHRMLISGQDPHEHQYTRIWGAHSWLGYSGAGRTKELQSLEEGVGGQVRVLPKTIRYQMGRADAQAGLPSRSTRMELPNSREKPISAQGRNGAWKVRRPKKLTLTWGLRRLHTYTSMTVSAWPKKKRLPRSPSS